MHGIAIGSDHTPISLRLDPAKRREAKMFKFEQMWLEKPECLKVINSAWSRGGTGREVPHINLTLRTCCDDLTKWNKSCFGNNRIEIERTQIRLQFLAASIPNAQSLLEAKVLKSKLDALWKY